MRNKGFSVTLTTVILTGVLLTVLGVSLFISNTVIEYHIQATEYENAQNLITYLADAVEQVALGTGGARYVRFSLRRCRLDFIRNYFENDIIVKLDGQVIIQDNPDGLVLRGGNMLTAPPFNVLYPEGVTNPQEEFERYIVYAGEPLTLVYETYQEAPTTLLMCRRIRVNYLGIYSVLENSTLKHYNVFEIVYINLTIGRTGGVGTVPVIARNKGVNLTNYYLDANSFTLSYWIGSELKQQVTMQGDVSADGTMVVVRIANLEIGTVG